MTNNEREHKCDLCGTPVRVVGDETKHYEPIRSTEKVERMSDEQKSRGFWIWCYGTFWQVIVVLLILFAFFEEELKEFLR